MNMLPPKRALKFLRWFCRKDYLEEIEGDLVELFEKHYEQSPVMAKSGFTWSIIKYFRPGFIRSFGPVNNLNTTTMLKHNVKISWRSLKRQPFFTVLNTFGLAIGMAGALLISLFIYDELSFDKMFPDADRIYRVNIDNKTSGEVNKYAAVSGPLAEAMRRDYPHLELATRFRHTGSKLVRHVDANQNVKEDDVVGVDETFFEMFGLDLLYGNMNTAFDEKNSVVLTRKAAEKHFPIDKALGQSLLLDNEEVFIVRGVIEDLPKNSFLRNHTIFISISSFQDADSPAWNNWNFPTFVRLRNGASEPEFQEYLGTVLERYLLPWAIQFIPGLTVESMKEDNIKTGNYMLFDATPLTAIHLGSPNLSGEFSLNSDVQDVYILGIIGIFLVLLACVNFMNLSTARSLKRAKEVGIRKTLGSNRSGLIKQFLTEAMLITLFSLFVAILLASIAMPFFNQLSGKSLSIPFDQPQFWLILLGTMIILGLFSGSYPAFLMSKFSPIKGLKGGEINRSDGRIRSTLVIVQFAVSVFLIASTLVVFQQLSFIQHKDLGYDKDQILIIEDVDAAGSQVASFKEEIKRLSEVKSVSLSSYLPTPSERSGTTFFAEGHVMQADKAIIIGSWDVDLDYLGTLDIQLVAGRGFDENLVTDSSAIILNEAAALMLASTPNEVIGMRITDDFRSGDEETMKFSTVIGVVKDFHFETLRNNIDAMSLRLGSNADRMMIKLNTEDYRSTIANIEKIWTSVAPGQPLDFYFMDDSFDETYKAEQRLGSIFITFTILSIFIACLGLFGLAAFNAEKRSKEIGIRKVLGASVAQITMKLSKDFLKLVIVSIVLSLPIAWYAMNKWLEDFSYRIEVPMWALALAAILAVLISILTMSFQSIKAALSNPVDSLRSE
jgi:putative ABC transport system permease protein